MAFGKTVLSLKELVSLIYKKSRKMHLYFISPINPHKDDATVSGTDIVSVFLKPFKTWVSRMKSIFFSSFRAILHLRLYTSDRKMEIIWSIKKKINE